MQISLRKAKALQTSINDAIKGINVNTTVTINEFQEAEAVLAAGLARLGANIERRTKLNTALYEMREAVGALNATSGVSDRLTSIAYIEKTIQFYATLATAEERIDPVVLAGKLAKIYNTVDDGRGYGRATDVQTSVLDAEMVKSFQTAIAVAKKEKQKLQDQVLELNIQAKITLSDVTVATLTAENIL